MVSVPEGFLFSAVSCGIKKEGKLDLGLIFCERKGTAWGVFTKNTLKAAPVLIGKTNLKEPFHRAIVANSGVANAATGEEGIKRAEAVLKDLASLLKVKPLEILPASTGVIGEQLPLDKILPKLSELVAGLSPDRAEDFAKAIMTTDTFPKIAQRTTKDGVKLLGIAKGAGMIAPNMATMLAFILTDGYLKKEEMRKLLSKAVDQSFNRITVDGDTSTNDTVYFLASGIKEVKDGTDFAENLISLAKELAYLIVKDGEGATKVIRVEIKGARNKEEARAFAMSIANSPLVKTAFYGADPNWGRILSALGKTGIDFDPQLVQIFLNDKPWVKELSVQTKEEDLRKEMQKNEVSLVVHLKLGKVSYEVLTCDLTEDYIRINASYRS